MYHLGFVQPWFERRKNNNIDTAIIFVQSLFKMRILRIMSLDFNKSFYRCSNIVVKIDVKGCKYFILSSRKVLILFKQRFS